VKTVASPDCAGPGWVRQTVTRAVRRFESEEVMVHIGKLLEPPAPGAGVEKFDRRRKRAERHADNDAQLRPPALFSAVGNLCWDLYRKSGLESL